MRSRESAQKIDDAAAAWAARIDRGLSTEEQAELDAWLAADTRRVGALARAHALWIHAGRAGASAAPDRNRIEVERPRITRRALLMGGAAAASLAGIGAFVILREQPGGIATDIGEIRRVALLDGSAITLDTDSRIRVAYQSFERRVTLLAGQAYFEVAEDPARPFLVEAGNILVQALGSSFSISTAAGLPISIVVSTGHVAVSRYVNGVTTSTAKLEANMSIDVARRGDVSTQAAHALDPVELDRTLAWREGKLSFSGKTLDEASRRFARYSAVRIVVDPPLAGERITGLFAANDPRGFAKAVAVSLHARYEENEKEIRLIRPVDRKK
jgi:transmembrane sensor